MLSLQPRVNMGHTSHHCLFTVYMCSCFVSIIARPVTWGICTLSQPILCKFLSHLFFSKCFQFLPEAMQTFGIITDTFSQDRGCLSQSCILSYLIMQFLPNHCSKRKSWNRKVRIVVFYRNTSQTLICSIRMHICTSFSLPQSGHA